MDVVVRKFEDRDVADMVRIWNEVVEDGIAFPQEDLLDMETGKAFFASQTHTAVAECDGVIRGMYILHPNNIGRAGHLGNTSYAVESQARGLHIGEQLVLDSIKMARECGFGILQFNAVVATNIHARHLYERCGFTQLGVIPKGFRMKDGHYEDICPMYIEL